MVKKENINQNTYIKTILIIDDSAFCIKIIKLCLEDEDYNILSVQNPFDALTILESEKIDAILLDIIMPIINGYSFLRIIKARKQTINIPVILISSLDDEFDIKKGLSFGAASYIKKPFNSDYLKGQIKDVFMDPDQYACN